MVIPKITHVLGDVDLTNEISISIHDLDKWLKDHPAETLPAQMRASFENPTHPRVRLDSAWIKFLRQKAMVDWPDLQDMYQKMENLLRLY